jgi:hypothetical protein
MLRSSVVLPTPDLPKIAQCFFRVSWSIATVVPSRSDVPMKTVLAEMWLLNAHVYLRKWR